LHDVTIFVQFFKRDSERKKIVREYKTHERGEKIRRILVGKQEKTAWETGIDGIIVLKWMK